MTILQILNDGKKLLIGDETKSESLTENLTQKTEDDGMKLSDAEVTPVTPSYAHGVLICAWRAHNSHEVL
jgi:hypothetical protein